MLSNEEQRQLLIDWQGRQRDDQDSRCLHRLFEVQAERVADATALVCGVEHLSYRALNAKANQLAHYLQARGVGREALVAICLERSLELIIAILGVLKSGAAYLPIDPAYPEERKRYLLADAQAALMITRIPAEEAGKASCEYVDWDSAWKTIAAYPTSTPCCKALPENLAYVIYTSGSTGKPKGVQISHRNAVHATRSRFSYYQEPVNGFLLLSSCAFDSSVAGIFWTLGQGGRLCLPEESRYRDPAFLVNLIAARRISHLLCLPSFYQLLLEHGGGKLAELRAAIVAGESCPGSLVDSHYRILPAVPLFNEYGPTEGTVWSTVCRVAPAAARCDIPIGRPIDDVQAYLLDSSFNPVPVGAVGEMYIGGAGVARGYLNRPDQTAERFMPDPFTSGVGARLYKTGDLARYRADGSIEFLGRIDHQVKIRGFRIELGEIEARLWEHPDIDAALVLARTDANGGPSLIAYCVVSTDGGKERGALSDGELREFLKAFLPDYMLPSAFVLLDAFPLTPNGKLDRNALIAQETPSQVSAGAQAGPRRPSEAALVRIWSEVLGVESLGIHDNFFERGGHSLLAVQLVFKVNEVFKRDLDLTALFEQPTVAMLADLIDHGAAAEPETHANRVDLADEAQLDPTIRPAPHAYPSFSPEPEHILLTGASGFLGAFLLHELLQQTSANLHCLVRAENAQAAADKLHRCLERYEIYDPACRDRVIPVCGDLSSVRLGLSPQHFQALAERIDVVYHNGALVNFVQPYAALKPANVLGTREVLRFACLGKVKPVHYVSTLSVFGAGTPPNPLGFSEEEFPGADADLPDGYSQSKWVAEQMVRTAANRGLPVSIYRPASVTGHSGTGAWNSDDFLCRLIRGCIDMGAAPNVDMHFDVVPVDYVSRAIIYLSRINASIGNTFHINNQHIVQSSQLVKWLNIFGYPVKTTPYSEWRNKVKVTISKEGEHHPLFSLVAGFPEENRRIESGSHTGARYSSAATQSALTNSDICCPVPDETLWQLYLVKLQNAGLIRRRG